MDMVPRTDFPGIRKKSTIRSKAGNILIIPREGERNTLTRFYIELPPGTRARDVNLEDLQRTAQSVFSPYTMEFVETVWWSAYSIGQRHADYFHKDQRVFLAGDACHHDGLNWYPPPPTKINYEGRRWIRGNHTYFVVDFQFLFSRHMYLYSTDLWTSSGIFPKQLIFANQNKQTRKPYVLFKRTFLSLFSSHR